MASYSYELESLDDRISSTAQNTAAVVAPTWFVLVVEAHAQEGAFPPTCIFGDDGYAAVACGRCFSVCVRPCVDQVCLMHSNTGARHVGPVGVQPR